MRYLMKVRSTLVMSAGIATMVAACVGSSGPTPGASEPPSSSPDRLDGTSWTLLSIDDEPVPPGTIVTLSFAAGTLSGSSSCNTYRGSYSVDGPTLMVGPLMATRMACPEPAMAIETAYLTALEGVDRWAVPQDVPIGTELTLLGSGPKLVLGPSGARTG